MPTEAALLARLGGALASEARAGILCALLGGTAHTNTELAHHLALSPSSISEHVGVLLDAGLVEVAAQGRHRYVRLADARTAELLEHLGVMAGRGVPSPGRSVPAPLAYARSCYGHLAGALGVRVNDGLRAAGALTTADDGTLAVTTRGHQIFTAVGITTTARGRPVVRACLDWTERRQHLAGSLADDLLTVWLRDRWVLRHPSHPRALQLTALGRRSLHSTFSIEAP